MGNLKKMSSFLSGLVLSALLIYGLYLALFFTFFDLGASEEKLSMDSFYALLFSLILSITVLFISYKLYKREHKYFAIGIAILPLSNFLYSIITYTFY